MLDERVDKFSELVDSNLETLRKAIADNRDVYVSVINKSNLEQEERMNGFVEDLENIVNELFEVQQKLDNGGVGLGGGSGAQEGSDNIAKQLHDLEAHLNTSIITEKSVRKAQDKYLAEEIDKFGKQMSAITDRLKIHMDEEGNVIAQNKSKVESDLAKTKEEVASLTSDAKKMRVELNDLKEVLERGDNVKQAEAMKQQDEKLSAMEKKLADIKEA